ncbi:unnamed protein product [Vicia faba]|uniref:Uncharacterized protein n=1 Tax=Vicia faba TaxID=3906 RepID=A0AAV1AR94_VICFA|nr:unnamed protein product [Vicia faba]
MDLGYNFLSGTIPTWFGQSFPFLRILILRSNAFYGELSLDFSKLDSLQILDLARNDLSGNIPASLSYLKAIAQVQKKNKYLLYGKFEEHYYEESLDVIVWFGGSQLVNKPYNWPNMLQLSSLDLSNNKLTGTIPSSLSSLSFLGSLDLSNNNLRGVIPYTGHMTTFDALTFTGNPGLCGPPLPVKCSGDDDNRHSTNNDTNGEGLFDNWSYLSLGLGFATGILVPYLIITIKSSWGDVYFDFVDQIIYKLLRLTRRQGKDRRKIHQRQ